MGKARILLAAHIGYPWGGISQRYSDLLNSNIRSLVDLFFVETSGYKRKFSEAGENTLRNLLNTAINLIIFLRAFLKVKPAIVHIATAYGPSFMKHSIMIIISKLFKAKVILAPHCSIEVFIPKNGSLYKKYLFFILKKCDGIIVLSKEWLALQNQLQNVKLFLLPNAINCDKYLNIIRNVNAHTKANIIFLGHIGKEKGCFELVQASRIVKNKLKGNFQVNLYGESLRNGETAIIDEMIQNLRLTDVVTLRPPVFHDYKIEVYRHADIFVLPSHHEGMPISIIEAMASGLPIIATAVGGIPDLVIHNENGILIPINDPLALANALCVLIQNPTKRANMGNVGRERVIKNHLMDSYVDKLVEFYKVVQES